MNTGLPDLPKGQFWRVSRHSSRYLELELELRAKHLFGTGSHLIQNANIKTRKYYNSTYTQDELRELIREAAEEMLRERVEKDILNSSLSELTGDYPPKRLEA